MEPNIDAEKPVKTEMQKLEYSFTKLYNENTGLKVNLTKALESKNKLTSDLKQLVESNQKLSQEVMVLSNQLELYERIINFMLDKGE